MIQPQSLEQIANQSPSVFLRRYPSYMIGSFAALALILAVVGLYGLISHMVLQRTREIGIRVALGAQRRDILRMVLRQGILATVAGVAVGIVAALALTRLLSSLLFGVTPGDWVTFLSVAVLLVVVAVVACSIPARPRDARRSHRGSSVRVDCGLPFPRHAARDSLSPCLPRESGYTPLGYQGRTRRCQNLPTWFRGLWIFYFSKILTLEPLNGFAISIRLKQVSGEVLQVSDGSLYPALHKLEQEGWIKAEWSRARKTAARNSIHSRGLGRRHLEREADNWNRLSAAISQVIKLEET